MKYTSAEANKLVRKLDDKIRDLLSLEDKASVFRAASSEDIESLRPEYDFGNTQAQLEELMAKHRAVKHAINVFNTTHELPGFAGVTIDQALIYIPQLNSRKETLRSMAARLPKERVEDYYNRSNIIDYRITNYDRETVKAAYDRTADTLTKLQLALDTVNTTAKMEIDVTLD